MNTMKTPSHHSPEDSLLTDYLLNEMSKEERLDFEKKLKNDPNLQKELEALSLVTENLRQELQSEPKENLYPEQIMAIERHIQARRKIVHLNFKESGFPWGLGIGIAATLAFGWLWINQTTPDQNDSSSMATTTVSIPLTIQPPSKSPEPIVASSVESATPWNSDSAEKTPLYFPHDFPHESEKTLAKSKLVDLPAPGFISTQSHTLASVALDVRSRSYEAIQKSIEAGKLPSPEMVQIDSILNAFKINKAGARGNDPYQIDIQLTSCPWNSKNMLARIAFIRNEKDLEINRATLDQFQWHFKFNPDRIVSYRILGSETPSANTISTQPPPESVPPQFQRVVLIEISPKTNRFTEKKDTDPVWITVETQHQNKGEAIIRHSFKFDDEIQSIEQTSSDIQLAAAGAEFGLLLQKSTSNESLSWKRTVELARNGLGDGKSGERHQFLSLIEKASRLAETK